MAEENAVPENLDDQPAEADAPAKGGGKMKVILLIIGVCAVEAGIFMFLASPGDAKAEEEEDTAADAELVEVRLEKKTYTNGTAKPHQSIQVTAEIAVLVNAKQEETFRDLVKKRKASIEDAIRIVLESASMQDIDDPNKAAIKRLIREEINKVLRKSIVNDIKLSECNRFGGG